MRGSPAERFWDKVDKSGACWLWTGAKSKGYGLFTFEGRMTGAHRFAYQITHGNIPDGHVIDHLCHVAACVNPAHLEAVTQKQNMENRRGAQPRNRSGIRGVYWNKAESKWQAQVTHNYKTHYAGKFDDLDEAAEVVEALRLSLYTHSDMAKRRAA